MRFVFASRLARTNLMRLRVYILALGLDRRGLRAEGSRVLRFVVTTFTSKVQ